MNKNFRNKHSSIFAAGAALFLTSAVHAQIDYSKITVHRVGDGVISLGTRSTAIYLDQYSASTAGQTTPVNTIALPFVSTGTNGSARITESGSASSNAHITLSPNGKYFVIPGYDADSGTSSITSSSVNRVIDTVGVAGVAGRVASAASVFTSNFRCAVTDSNNNYWGSGNANGIYYFGNTAAASGITTSTFNTRCVRIVNGELYYSSASSSAGYGISKVGTGLPVTSGQAATAVITTGTSTTTTSPYDFAFNSAMTVCYIADNRDIASGGGIQKWTNNGTAWSLAYTMGTGNGSTVGALAMTVDFTTANPTIYAVTDSASGNKVVKIVDGGSAATATVTTIATAGAGKYFRGISFSPTAAVTPPNGVPQLNAQSVHIYPSPAIGLLHIASSVAVDDVQLTDLAGRKVIAFEAGRKMNLDIPVSTLQPGLYLLNIRTAEGQLTRKVQIGQ